MSCSSSICVSRASTLRLLISAAHVAPLEAGAAEAVQQNSRFYCWRSQVIAWMTDVSWIDSMNRLSRFASRAWSYFVWRGDCPRKSHIFTRVPIPSSQVAADFSIEVETLSCAVSFFDRVVSVVQIPSETFQIAALACIFIGEERSGIFLGCSQCLTTSPLPPPLTLI